MKHPLQPEDVRVFSGGLRFVAISFAVALLGLAAMVLGSLLEPERTAHAYLTAFTTCATTSFGALVFLAIVHAMNAKWPVAVRRLVEACVVPLFVLALAFVPIALATSDIYTWARPIPEELPKHVVELLHKKRAWLDVEFFWGRSAFYLLCWVVIGGVLLRWSARQDRSESGPWRVRQRRFAAGSLPLLALTLTFAAFDWVMSLDPLWFSTMFGIYLFSGGFAAAFAVLTIATTLADAGGWLRGIVNRSHYYAWGRLMLAFVAFWAYAAFFQFMLQWIANRPEEVAWFIERTDHGWQWIALSIVVVHFVVPFIALLSYRIKFRPRALSVIAAILLLAHWLEVHWMIVPAGHFDWIVHWVDLGALMLVAGTCVAVALLWMRGRPMAPRHDPALPKGVRYQSA